MCIQNSQTMKKRVKELIKEKGYTQEAFAKALGISRESLLKTIDGNPTIDTLRKFCDVLGVEVWELFDGAPRVADGLSCPHCGKPLKIRIE